ncbi:hypothetical protein PIB30_032002 [Stylosanthes scabra]|uniref:RRM domain-containing protein n=1 Tax=Stylosanthes scabra TaxID=79078 RepID=A0ABU6VE92_9FABA|nr:hypothetical protein [Stylosanthes scabra]
MEKGPNFVPGLFVGFIPPTMTNGQLQDHFAKYGKITDSVILNDQRPKYGFVNFTDPSSVDKAIQDTDHFINGRKVTVRKGILTVRPSDREHIKTNRLYVYQITQHVSSDELATFFGEYGQVISCCIERDQHYGWIYFQFSKTVDDVLAAHGNWINFRGRFMLEISKHIIERHLKNANRSGEGGDFGAYDPHQTAVYNPAGGNMASGLHDANGMVVNNQLWQPYANNAMVPFLEFPNSTRYRRYYYPPPPIMYNPQYVIPFHYGYGGVFTQGASGSGGPSNASQDDDPDSLFSQKKD